MKYEAHVYGIEFEIEHVFRNEKNRNSFCKLMLKWNTI